MITYALSVRRSHVSLRVFLVAGLLLLSVAAIANPAAPETRLSITTQGSRADIDSGSSGVTSTDEFDGLSVEGERSTNKSSTTLSKSGFTTSAATNSDFWFYTADVELFNDHDRDGFFHGIDLYFDADTYYSYAEVYAVVYLSQEGGPWSEYAVTENFTLYGATSEDDYVIATELLSGYPSGSYDLLVELFDAWDDSFVAWIGPEDTPELAFLPLEDANRDVPDTTDVIVVNNHSGGGAAAWLSILLLAQAALVKNRLERRA